VITGGLDAGIRRIEF